MPKSKIRAKARGTSFGPSAWPWGSPGGALGPPPRLLAVVGASGSGKSSLVRAGLAVALKRAGWDTRVFTPTAEPLKSLVGETARANRDANTTRVVWLVDQFEEVFTLCREDAARAAFIERLLAAANAPDGLTTVVIALRADFYSHCAQFPRLRGAIAGQQEFIGQMSEEELRRAIEDPAKRGGWVFEPGLVDTMLRDIGAGGQQAEGPTLRGAFGPAEAGAHLRNQEPGALPLLSHALLATWERRRGRTLALDGYHASGGVHGAIAETAESVFADRLDQQPAALRPRHLFASHGVSQALSGWHLFWQASRSFLVNKRTRARSPRSKMPSPRSKMLSTRKCSSASPRRASWRQWP